MAKDFQLMQSFKHYIDWEHFSLQLHFCLLRLITTSLELLHAPNWSVCLSLSLELTLKADWRCTSRKEFHIKENQRDQLNVQRRDRSKKKQVPWNYRFIPSLLRQTPENVIQKHRKIVQCSL